MAAPWKEKIKQSHSCKWWACVSVCVWMREKVKEQQIWLIVWLLQSMCATPPSVVLICSELGVNPICLLEFTGIFAFCRTNERVKACWERQTEQQRVSEWHRQRQTDRQWECLCVFKIENEDVAISVTEYGDATCTISDWCVCEQALPPCRIFMGKLVSYTHSNTESVSYMHALHPCLHTVALCDISDAAVMNDWPWDQCNSHSSRIKVQQSCLWHQCRDAVQYHHEASVQAGCTCMWNDVCKHVQCHY